MTSTRNKSFSKILCAIALVMVLGSVALLADPLGWYVSGTWRYKTTIVVETPEGLKSGSAVRKVSNARLGLFHLLPIPAGNPASVIGEAVVVDLGSRGKLFGLLKGYHLGDNYGHSIVYSVFRTSVGGSTKEGIRYYRSLKNAKAVLEPKFYPVLVTFTDINDPKTVKSVMEIKWGDDKISGDHFEELFGKGVKLKEIIIETTDEPVTWEIKQVLPWLSVRSKQGGYIGGDINDIHKDPSGTNVRARDFIKGKQ